MDGPARVLMVIETYGRAGGIDYTGAGEQLRTLAPRLQERGVVVQVLTSQVGREGTAQEEDGVLVTRLGVAGGTRRSARFAQRTARFAQRVPHWMMKHRRAWDIVHIHGVTRTAFAAIAAARVLGKKSLVKFTMLGSDDAVTVGASRLGAFKLALLGLADAYVAPSTALAEAATRAGLKAERVVRIPNGVDMKRFAPAAGEARARVRGDVLEPLGWPRDALVALFVARSSRGKVWTCWRRRGRKLCGGRPRRGCW